MRVILVVVKSDGAWDRFYSDALEASKRAEEIGGIVEPALIMGQPGQADPGPSPSPTPSPSPASAMNTPGAQGGAKLR